MNKLPGYVVDCKTFGTPRIQHLIEDFKGLFRVGRWRALFDCDKSNQAIGRIDYLQASDLQAWRNRCGARNWHFSAWPWVLLWEALCRAQP